MDLLRNLFGNVTSGIIRLAVFAGMLLLLYLLIVKPVLKTTTDAIHSTGLDQIGKSMEGVSTEIKREVHRTFEGASPGGQRNKLVHCVQHAEGNVHRIERCTRRF
ncbi:MAG TPA: hypothetical protein VKH20_06615 [Solirubrobacterales bacterium]|nr:hypothetical protein [Solirubrobacterales bacterium]